MEWASKDARSFTAVKVAVVGEFEEEVVLKRMDFLGVNA